jgi:hypothetical protein
MTDAIRKFSSRQRRAALAAVSAGLLIAAAATAFQGSGQPARPASPVRVIGTLFAAAPAAAQARSKARSQGKTEIELPDVEVYLADARGRRSGQATTRLDGRFELWAPAPGRYRLCYRTPMFKGCGATLSLRNATFPAGRVAVSAKPWLHGRVLTRDGRACWMADTFFRLDVSTQVSASQGGINARPRAVGRANVQGEYALFGLKRGGYSVTARCEGAIISSRVDLRNVETAFDLTLPNRAPVIRTAAALKGSIARYRAVAGTALDLQADVSDPDGDNVQYMWRALDHAGQLVSGGGAAAQWTLPDATGYRTAYLIARDGRGGFAYERVDLEVARDDRVEASGRALDETTGMPIAGATVTFGSGSTQTDANGWFMVRSDARDDARYVLNIGHANYALLSRILDRSVRGNGYELIPAQVSQHPAAATLSLTDRSSGGFCGRDRYGRERPLLRRVPRPGLAAFQPGRAITSSVQPAAASALASPTQPPVGRCISRGAEIVIPAGALVDSRKRRAQGAVRAAITTLNPARRALPGDYEAVGAGGAPVGLVSFGAVDVQLSDAGGRPLELRQGAAAQVRIPVPPGQVASAAPSIRIWSYDAAQGRWVGEGQAVLEQTSAGAFYVGKTRHFSVINMDIELNVANATCVRVTLDDAFGTWDDLVLRAYATFAGGTAVQVKETQLNLDEYHRIAALPYGNGFPPNTLRLELRGTFNNVQQVLLENVINTDARPQMDPSGGLFPPPDYAQCGDPIVLSPDAGTIPYYGDLDATGRPAFLTGPDGTSFNPNPPQAAAYYAAIDPGTAKDELGKWWNLNGFGADGQGAGNPSFTRASYMNHNDLGFGRDMHCVEPGGGKLACYVTNYGAPNQIDQNAQDAVDRNPATRGATVTMEFDPGAGTEAVQFYVFGGGDSAAPRLLFADLDGLGPKPVPHLCMVCHGGNFVGNKVQYARFREFDLPSFRYSGNRSWNFGQATLNAAELTAYARLNKMVRDAHPAPIPIGALIDGWYPGGFGAGTAPAEPDPPADWDDSAAEVAGYHEVYGPTCRTCHVARDEGDPNAYYVFGDYENFKSLSYAVCGSGTPKRRIMPNAFITYRNFWVDTSRVLKFEALMDPQVSNCGN